MNGAVSSPAKNTTSVMSSSTSRLDLIIAFQVACASAAPRTASVTSRGNGAEHCLEVREIRRDRAGNLRRVVPEPNLHRVGSKGLADEALGVGGAEHPALELQAALRILGQPAVVVGARGAKVAFRIDMEPDGLDHHLGEMSAQERQRGVLVLVVYAAQRRRFAAVVEHVADVVQQRRAYKLARRASALGMVRALQRVLELRNPLAVVFAAALYFVEPY